MQKEQGLSNIYERIISRIRKIWTRRGNNF